MEELEAQGILDPSQDGDDPQQQQPPHDEILAELERCQAELRSGRGMGSSQFEAFKINS